MNLKKELSLITIVLIPFIYLGYVWNQLPEKVPMKWGFDGEINKYEDKIQLLLIPLLLPLLTYVMFLVVPKIDPKNNLNKMGNKLSTIKFITTTIMSVLALFIIYAAKNETITNPNYLILLIGCLYIIFGNYFKTIKANYFIGIRTPWTLESESVWRETHKLGGKLWFVGGIITVFTSLTLSTTMNFTFFLIITAVITIVPVVYSYLLFKKERNKIENSVE